MANQSKICWVGSTETDVEAPSIVKAKLSTKTCHFYRKCIYGAITLKVGDFVLISSAGSVDSDSVDSCEIGRITHLFETENLFEEVDESDQYQAIVQWYSRPENIPHRLFDNDTITVDFNLELIEDHRAFDPVVSIDSIFQKCMIISGDPWDSAVSLMSKITKLPTFICRFKIVKVAGNHYLIPLKATNVDIWIQSRSVKEKTPKSSTKKPSGSISASKKSRQPELEFVNVEEEPLVSPIKIVRNSVIKLHRAASSSKKSKTPAKMEVNANYLLESPDVKRTKISSAVKLNGARRNLNESLEANSTADSDTLNYSIIQNSPSQVCNSNLKIKLRLSENQQESSEDRLPAKSPSTRRSQSVSTDKVNNASLNQTLSAKKRKDDYDENDECENIEISPKRTRRGSVEDYPATPSTKGIASARRKSILKTPNGRLSGTPKRNIQLSNIAEEVLFHGNSSLAELNRSNTPRRSRKVKYNDNDDSADEPTPDEPKTPKSRRSSISTPTTKSNLTSAQKQKLIRSGVISPAIEKRTKSSKRRSSCFEAARERLHVSAVPESLPCREKEFDDIYTFLEGKLNDQCGGCMYVSGVPGTGKTATVTGVIRALKHDAELDRIPDFQCIEINGMRLTEPRQAYVQIYKQMTGKTVSWEHAQNLLEKRFTKSGPRRQTTILVVDELDILCNRRQDVVYNLLDWPTKSAARLVVLTIANTMDLPERMLMGKVTSRLGLTRLTFQPYSHKQLQEIVTSRLCGSDAFKSDAVQLVARKVAAVSGDARRALDICRRATEIAEETGNDKIVTMIHVQKALSEMIATLKVQAIKKCSKVEKLFLQAVEAEVTRTGVEETTFLGVYTQLESIAAFMGTPIPVPGRALQICAKLGAERLLICEHSRTDIFMKILLNVSSDDIHYALQVKH